MKITLPTTIPRFGVSALSANLSSWCAAGTHYAQGARYPRATHIQPPGTANSLFPGPSGPPLYAASQDRGRGLWGKERGAVRWFTASAPPGTSRAQAGHKQVGPGWSPSSPFPGLRLAVRN